jgi:RNA polymerase sigma-70 factor (ECF subfamily)
MNGSELPEEIVEQFADCLLEQLSAEFDAKVQALQEVLRRQQRTVCSVLAALADEMLALALRKSLFPREAFTELYNRHWRRVGGWMIRFGAEPNEAFDLAQGVFLTFYRTRLQHYDPTRSFLAYLRRAAYHLWIARDVRRRRPDLTPHLDAGAAPGGVEDELIRRDLEDRLDEALARLPEPQHRIMERMLTGEKPAAIAAALGLARPAVFRLLWKARNTLAADLRIQRPPTKRGRKPRPDQPDSASPNR